MELLRSVFHHVITYLLLINFSPPNIVANAIGNETDWLALLKFKESIVSDPLGLLSSWNESSHFCNWQGITCGTRHQRVTRLNLQDSGLHGTVSPYIGNLSFLRLLDLQNNSFSGKVPKQVHQLFRLRHLLFGYNMLEGEIPGNLTFSPELNIISFGSNRLHGKIPEDVGSAVKLLVLDFVQNNLTGVIPSSLGNLSSIMELALDFNNLVGEVPEGIGRLKTLSLFTIGANNLSGMIPPSLFNISSMYNFSIVDNSLEGSIPAAVGLNMPNLVGMYLGDNKLYGKIPASFSNASQLEDLGLTGNNFVGKVPTSFGCLPKLLWLDFGGNNLGTSSDSDLDFITPLTNCSKLQFLGFHANNFGGVLPNSIANLSSQLTYLYLGNNQITGRIPAAFPNLNNLIALDLHNNMFTGVIPSSFGKFQLLQSLGLHNNRISGRIPSSIGNLTRLYQLYLSGNQLRGSIPPSIGNCKSLKEMDISQNSLSGDLPPDVIGLSSLSILLNLSRNLLTGTLPVEVGKLRNIYALDISENNLTGEIPATIGGCQGLEFLYLQGNLFQEIIPSSLASSKGLQNIDLSRNNLSGKIPKDLQSLHFLLYLNLSFNKLEGEVPQEGAFRNASAVSLVGNTKLCGGVSDLKLPACPVKLPTQRKRHGFKLKFILPLVIGCSLLLSFFSVLHWRTRLKKNQLSAVSSSINFFSRVSYQTLHQATSGFSPSTLIGSGSFSSVYKGILDEEENNIVAIKVLNLQLKGGSKSFVAECNALRNIRHRNLVKILTCCSSTDYNGNDFKALVFEYMSNGSLEEWLHSEEQSRSLNLLQRLNIVVDVASALCYLHDHCEPPIIHRDIKPSNVLLDDDMVPRVGDFGLARIMSNTTECSQTQSSTIGIKGTIGYAAPEYGSGAEASKQGDVYSYGILLLEMFTGRKPTDEMFKDGLNLHNFVKMAIPESIVQIVDPTLLATVEVTVHAGTGNEVNYMESGYRNEIEAGEENRDYENLSKMDVRKVWKCIRSIFEIGLTCSEESPKKRMSLEDVVKNLHHVQNAFNDAEIISRVRPGRS